MAVIPVVRLLSVLVVAASVASCTVLKTDAGHFQDVLALDYPSTEDQPTYQPDLSYLPVAYGGRMSWVVQGGQAVFPGTAVPLTTWYGQAGRLLRLHGDKLLEVAGYTSAPLQIADNCPLPASLPRITKASDCVRTFLTPRQGTYLARVRVRQLPPEPLRFRLGSGEIRDGWIVREQLPTVGRQGNFYLFDAERRYVMSRQWLDERSAFDVFSVERAE